MGKAASFACGDSSSNPLIRLPISLARHAHFTDHVTVKPMEEIRTESFVATLHSAALMIVDYINADGTLNRRI